MKILITGGTNGMGKGLAKVLSSIDDQMHEVVILCRSKELGEAVVKEIAETTANYKTSFVLCDLAKLSDVKRAISEIKSKHESLDSIFVNAGLGYAPKRVETEDGMDSHFQVNYLSHYFLVLNLLDLLEKSETGGRVIFNATQLGEILWNDMQMKHKWGYEDAIFQAMTAKRMFLLKLHNLYRSKPDSRLSFIGFQIPKTVWTNQLNIIPKPMKLMATIAKAFGKFITIEESGRIMSPLFTEPQSESYSRSGKFITWSQGKFVELQEDVRVLNQELQDRLWNMSLELCQDEETTKIASLGK